MWFWFKIWCTTQSQEVFLFLLQDAVCKCIHILPLCLWVLVTWNMSVKSYYWVLQLLFSMVTLENVSKTKWHNQHSFFLLILMKPLNPLLKKHVTNWRYYLCVCCPWAESGDRYLIKAMPRTWKCLSVAWTVKSIMPLINVALSSNVFLSFHCFTHFVLAHSSFSFFCHLLDMTSQVMTLANLTKANFWFIF